MNAYKLADELERIGCTTYCRCEETIPMLRQQADRIAELEHMNKNWQLSETMAYNRISDLERKAKAFEQSCRVATTQIKALQAELETNAKPVAWMYKVNGVHTFWNSERPPEDAYDEGTLIPLYTTPQTKPLSDAEQDACFNRGYKEGIRDTLARTPQTKPLSGEEILEIYESIWNRPMVVEDISFARAIEERILGK
jgi:hypothetical protein